MNKPTNFSQRYDPCCRQRAALEAHSLGLDLLIAGGSDGVFRIFSKLGIRNPVERKEKAEEERKRRVEKARAALTPSQEQDVNKTLQAD